MLSLFRRYITTARSIGRGVFAYMKNDPAVLRADVLRIFLRTRNTARAHSGKKIAELLPERRVRFWIDGRKSFRRIRFLIDTAELSIIIRMFIWRDDQTGKSIRNALLRSADRGVQIHITKEGSGDFFEINQSFLDTKASPDPLWQKFWEHRNITIEHSSSRDHAKVYIIDGRITLLTGMNIADEYEWQWHDYLVELRGSHYAKEILEKTPSKSSAHGIRLVINTQKSMAVRQEITRLIKKARTSIVVEHCYFSDELVLQELIDASVRGIRITVIVPSSKDMGHHANLLTIEKLIQKGAPGKVRVLMFPGMFHPKLMLIDKNCALVGSANLNSLSLDRTGEVCVELRKESRVLKKIRRAVRKTIRRSTLRAHPHSRFFSRFFAMIGL